MTLREIFFIMVFGLFQVTLVAQIEAGLVAYYSFDNCDAADQTANGADGVITGSPECVCGLSGSALRLDGLDDYIQFLGNFDIVFSADFTLSFFFKPDATAGVQDIFSKREACGIDSTFSLRFNAASKTVLVELSENLQIFAEAEAPLDLTKCWHHVALVRRNNEIFLYYNGTLASTDGTTTLVNVENNGIFSIANSPCLTQGEMRYRGSLDEVKLFNRALSSSEIESLFFPVDEILTRDTVIFDGNTVQIRLSATCADEFDWLPSTNVIFPDQAEPSISPDETTLYTVSMDYGNCVATDQVNITVVDSLQLDCNNIFLPKAFTPNADGLNDTYGLSNVVYLGEILSFEIFDRWGGQIFSGANAESAWDGTIQGKEAMPGGYLYKLRYRCEGVEDFLVGSFTLIR